jgi:hypothetical protein
MALSPGEAAEQLKEIEETGRRSAEAHEYAEASPHFILWGAIWVAGYAGSDVVARVPHEGSLIGWLWLVLAAAGVFGSATLNRRRYQGLAPGIRCSLGLRWGMSFLVIYVFLFADMLVMRPSNPVAIGALIPLMVATIYAIFGIWKGLRFLYAGIAVAALTLGGWLYLPEHFLLWMAGIGGGSLILVGLWLRKI